MLELNKKVISQGTKLGTLGGADEAREGRGGVQRRRATKTREQRAREERGASRGRGKARTGGRRRRGELV